MPAVRRTTLSARALLAMLIALVLAFTLTPTTSASAADVDLVVNGDFSQGATGWRTNQAAAHPLTIGDAQGRNGSKAAVITPSNAQTVVLNDAVDTVKNGAKGTSYTATAWVRSDTANAVASIAAREIGSGSNYRHEARVRLNGTGWHEVSLTFTTKFSASTIDLNVLFWSTRAGQRLFVDSVSLTTEAATAPTTPPTTPVNPDPAPTPDPVPTPTPAPTPPSAPGSCERPAPTGTKFGSSVSTSGQTIAQALSGIDAIFGRSPVIRVFDPGMVMPWSKPRTQHIAGRDLVMSFRPLPQDVLSGKYDAELRAWFREAPSDVTIYWSYIHEPEPMINQGTFTADQYRRAWQHIDKIADSVCRTNMHATLILTGWTTLPASKRDWRTYYAGGDVIDVMAFDPYNGASNPTGVTSYPTAASLFDSVRKVANEAGKPYGIAETGSPKVPSDTTGSKRAAWLTELAAYHRQHGALFVTYFHSSRDGEWRLLDGPSQTAWRAAVASSR